MLRVPFEVLQSRIAERLVEAGVQPDRAARCATLFAETTRDGVYTHGLNRLPRMLQMIGNGSISPTSVPTMLKAHSALESWDGNR